MVETLVTWFIETFGGLISKEALVFFISTLPILELRGGVLAGYFLGLPILSTTIFALLGNILPIPLYLMFIEAVLNWALKHKLFVKTITRLKKRALSKSSEVTKYEFWGLCIFVAIPLPGTGAVTGTMIAEALQMDRKKAMLSITLGVLIAGIIMLSISYGLLNFIGL